MTTQNEILTCKMRILTQVTDCFTLLCRVRNDERTRFLPCRCHTDQVTIASPCFAGFAMTNEGLLPSRMTHGLLYPERVRSSPCVAGFAMTTQNETISCKMRILIQVADCFTLLCRVRNDERGGDSSPLRDKHEVCSSSRMIYFIALIILEF